MSSVWIRIDDFESAPWAMRVVSSLEEATILSSADSQRAMRGADQRFPAYLWELIPTSLHNTFVAQGKPKRDSRLATQR